MHEQLYRLYVDDDEIREEDAEAGRESRGE
jgi:hypothetical protein